MLLCGGRDLEMPCVMPPNADEKVRPPDASDGFFAFSERLSSRRSPKLPFVHPGARTLVDGNF